MFEVVEALHPADRATVLSAGISEALNSMALALVAEIPLVLIGYAIDRWLRRQARPGPRRHA